MLLRITQRIRKGFQKILEMVLYQRKDRIRLFQFLHTLIQLLPAPPKPGHPFIVRNKKTLTFLALLGLIPGKQRTISVHLPVLTYIF